MSEAEEIMAALIYEVAVQTEAKHFRGPLSQLRQATQESYGLEKFADAFDAGLRFWADRGVATIHRYAGVETYVSLKGNDMVTQMSFMLEKDRFEAPEQEAPQFPILTSYFDVGGSWIHDVALALRDRDVTVQNGPMVYHSSDWTGRYEPDFKAITDIKELLYKIRGEVASAHLTNAERGNAAALLDAADKLIESPDPEWRLILEIISSPVLANLTAMAALVVALIKS